MSEMVERVARAICSSVGRDPDGPFKDQHGRPSQDIREWQRWQGEARAAIEAMREGLTEAMIDEYNLGAEYTAQHTWAAMIGAALKD